MTPNPLDAKPAPSAPAKPMTAQQAVAATMKGRLFVAVKDLPDLVLATTGVRMKMTTLRHTLSCLAAQGITYYPQRGMVSDRVAAGVEWVPPAPKDYLPRKRVFAAAAHYAILKTLLTHPDGLSVREVRANIPSHLRVVSLTSTHRYLLDLDRRLAAHRWDGPWKPREPYASRLLAEWQPEAEPGANELDDLLS